jgi:glycosyltransferase involved in cell wall biosynthesis
MKLLWIYQFCTFGGVERIILNRIEAFKNSGLDVKVDMVFCKDAGGFESFHHYIKKFDLSKYINLHIFYGDFTKSLKVDQYDLVLNIDTPNTFWFLNECKHLYVECHTAYKKNRKYLSFLPENVKALIVPSQAFMKEINSEPKLIYVLPNFVSEIFLKNTYGEQKAIFNKRPIAYLGRLDEVKNIQEVLEIFKEFRNRDDIIYFIIGAGVTKRGFIKKLRELDLLRKSVIRTKVDFDKVPQFFHLLKTHKGILISPSRSESFNLTVAESIASAVPVIASDIPPHRNLLRFNPNFLYPLGNTKEAKEKIHDLLDHWDHCSETIRSYAEPLRQNSFIEAWNHFVSSCIPPGKGSQTI